MEGLIHNLNTMHCRAGAQVPFSSINYGTDTTPEGRMVIKNILLAEDAGLGNGETPIFPIHIFKVQGGYQLQPRRSQLRPVQARLPGVRQAPVPQLLLHGRALQPALSTRRGDPKPEVAYMGCRTRVMANRLRPRTVKPPSAAATSRFTSINLPRLGHQAPRRRGSDSSRSWNEKIDLVIGQLLERFEIQSQQSAAATIPSSWDRASGWIPKAWPPDDEVGEVLKHGTLTIGFIGLAECLKALIGVHHGESEEAQEPGSATSCATMRERMRRQGRGNRTELHR